MSEAPQSAFAERLLNWFDEFGRKDLPWQHPRAPYRVWVSEIMLQQTQVATVIDYFQRFMQRFPTVEDLAAAPQDDVLHLWTGLGYYARARNLHKAAKEIVATHAGLLPNSVEALNALPGIGRSTAGAIVSQGFDTRAVILDGNVKRVLTRHSAIEGFPGKTAIERELWALADERTPAARPADYTQAIMDLGATLCVRKNPNCAACPVAVDCKARATNRVAEFPYPKPKREKPVRCARMYVVRGPDGDVLLEQRPQEGIWGGLWNPPERPDGYIDADFLAEYGLADCEVAPGEQFRHTFSHYHLDITPVFVQLGGALPGLATDGDAALWYQPEGNQQQLGLSAVAVKLIAARLPEPQLAL